MTKKEFHEGDRVEWDSHGGTAVGEVEEEITDDTLAAKRTVRASPEDPQYRVRSDNSGGEAVHCPEALRKPQD
jgi:hypothetical protein